jgi:tetratricopeptide (TPR) repeat protein
LNVSRWILSLAVALLVSQFSLAAEVVDEFEMANKFYEEKDYSSAIRLYESILNQGKESAPVYFNLGNAYFKSGDLGRAVLYYSRARRLQPGDEDIHHNLRFASQFSRVQMEGVELNPINTFLTSLVDNYRLEVLAWVSSGLFLLFLMALLVRWGAGINNSLVRLTTVISLILLLIACGLTSFKYRHDFLTRRAVIVANESPVYTGPSEQSDLELEGAPGLVVEILAESTDYFNVLFENKRRGWISRNLVAEI